jgi:hypothetical protein
MISEFYAVYWLLPIAEPAANNSNRQIKDFEPENKATIDGNRGHKMSQK